MATKKPAGAPRRAPRAPSKPKLAIVPPAPVATGTAVLVFRGGADLSFRDGSGAKRRVLRGTPFVVDSATAEILLATDATVAIWTPDTAPEAAPPAPEPAPQGGSNAPADDSTALSVDEAGTPPQPAPIEGMPSGAITLGDLPPGAVKSGG